MAVRNPERLLTNLRFGQRGAFLKTCELLQDGRRWITTVLPTRYGKSDLLRLLAWWVKTEGLFCMTLALNPNKFLRDQLVKEEKITAFLRRVPVFGKFRFLKVEGNMWNPGADGVTHLLSATMQTVTTNIDFWRGWVDSVITQHGKPPLLIVDEAHTGSEDNRWGSDIHELVDAGASAILMTATPDRADGRTPVGFNYEVLNEESTKAWITKPNKEPELVTVETWSATRRKIRLVPDYEYSFAESWQEKPSSLCKLSLLPFDIELWKLQDQTFTDGQKLSDLKEDQVRRGGLLGKIVKDDRVIDQAAKSLVKQLSIYKAHISDSAGIVFCGNDDEPEKKVNQHAKQIEAAIKSIDKSLKVVIATSASNDGDDNEEPGLKRIDNFVDGAGDVLIVKQMASLGLDCPRLKVGVDLSPIRTYAATVQRMMRIATPHENMRHAVWICPDDILSRGIFKLLTNEDATEDRAGWRTELENLLGTKDKKREENLGPIFGVNSTESADFEDTARNYAEARYLPSVETLFVAFPGLIRDTTHSEAAKRLSDLGIKVETQPVAEVSNATKEANDLKRRIQALSRAIVMTRLNGTYDQQRFAEAVKTLWNEQVYAPGLIPQGFSYTQVNDTGILKTVFQVLTKVNGGPVE